MLYKIKETFNIFLKKKNIKQQKHQEIHLKLSEKLSKIEHKDDEASLEEIMIIKKTLLKIEKELQDG